MRVMRNTLLAEGLHVQVHEQCEGRPCVIHNRNHMREWPLEWRRDGRMLERMCPHGVGHPDPDQFEFWRENKCEHFAWHTCDGCCTPCVPPPGKAEEP